MVNVEARWRQETVSRQIWNNRGRFTGGEGESSGTWVGRRGRVEAQYTSRTSGRHSRRRRGKVRSQSLRGRFPATQGVISRVSITFTGTIGKASTDTVDRGTPTSTNLRLLTISH